VRAPVRPNIIGIFPRLKDVTVAAYFVPSMTDTLNNPQSHKNPIETLVVEWDRNLIWAFANSGIFLLSSPALGTPTLPAGSPRKLISGVQGY
jgi:hypothetical protein